MFLTGLLIGALIATIALVIYVDYLDEVTLKREVKGSLPETDLVEVEDIAHSTEKEYKTTYKLKAHQKTGAKKDIEIRCKSGSVGRRARIRIK